MATTGSSTVRTVVSELVWKVLKVYTATVSNNSIPAARAHCAGGTNRAWTRSYQAKALSTFFVGREGRGGGCSSASSKPLATCLVCMQKTDRVTKMAPAEGLYVLMWLAPTVGCVRLRGLRLSAVCAWWGSRACLQSRQLVACSVRVTVLLTTLYFVPCQSINLGTDTFWWHTKWFLTFHRRSCFVSDPWVDDVTGERMCEAVLNFFPASFLWPLHEVYTKKCLCLSLSTSLTPSLSPSLSLSLSFSLLLSLILTLSLSLSLSLFLAD